MRGQGLPITVIIVAALGILVLIVIAAIFGGQIGKFGRAASECPGVCVVEDAPRGASAGMFVERSDGQCSQFETRLSGTYIAKGTPKDADLAEYMCQSCCVPTG